MNDLNNYQIVGKNSADKKEKVYKLNTEQKKVKLVEIMEEARENAIINPIQPIIGCKFLIMP